MKKIVIGTVLAVGLSGVTATAMGGLRWLEASGWLGAERTVTARVNGYWSARVEGDLERMASYVHPLQQGIPDPGMLVTEGYELHAVEIQGDEATAQLTVHSRLKHPVLSARERTVELQSKWVRYEGSWYMEPAPTNIHDTIRQFQGKWTPPTAKTHSDENTTSVQ